METKPVAQGNTPGYETRDASIRGLLIFALGLFATLVVTALAMFGVFRHYERSQSLGPPASPFADVRTLPPAPRLQVEPRLDLEHLRAREDQLLNSYGWVDPRAGVVRMPIDRAMDRLLEKGLPVRGESAEKK